MSRPFNNSYPCPHCNCGCRTVKSLQQSPLYREITFVCKNPECGHRFVVEMSPVRTITASQIPNPTIQLPMCRRA
ncbi:ogr/Delta-like zinc finger family protein [Thalassospira marina]|uniref:Transcriptional regulator n=1 Tax=Thalassospira marina TaxID=2048283 RepID=A0A2N3KWW3_9PROT|nr:transcriptional regulator [Thalassospira marina]|tara:strand:- start:7938 stop:8162 length:225 start_codon:yes stop_codon:yes gene_type:complete